MEWMIYDDKDTLPRSCVVEGLDMEDDGSIYLTRFYEPDARLRAEEYLKRIRK